MARIKIELPEKCVGTFSIPVRITDLNFGNHVANNAIVEIIHEARVQFLDRHHLTEMNAGGTSLIMSDLAVEFKSESFYKDVPEVKVFVGEVSRVSFELFYSFTVSRNNTSLVIARAKTGMVCFNYEEKKVVPVPEKLKAILMA